MTHPEPQNSVCDHKADPIKSMKGIFFMFFLFRCIDAEFLVIWLLGFERLLLARNIEEYKNYSLGLEATNVV